MAQSKKATSFTIRIDLLHWLEKKATEIPGANKSIIVEQALEKMKKDLTKQALIESCKRMKGDKEMKELANMGLKDYQSLIP